MRRGDIRTAVLAILVEEPGHGYDVIQRLEEKTSGAWRPSPGRSIRPCSCSRTKGSCGPSNVTASACTRSPSRAAKRRPQRIETAGGTPWEIAGRNDSGVGEFRNAIRHLVVAAKQVSDSGNQEQVERMIEILKQARKDIYTMLAED